ncbi:hypothetical protein [Methylobacterium sp. E-016]|uniref:hypothetical protein n=1 Tax=Methylobacterium sp. E-016 TaxID=2836556 RepID=UPI001FBBD08C|nr:hypothetical protein [Methylobacterium sp. E-016]
MAHDDAGNAVTGGGKLRLKTARRRCERRSIVGHDAGFGKQKTAGRRGFNKAFTTTRDT